MSDNIPSSQSLTILGLIGSPDRSGRTQRLVDSALTGAAEMGAKVESVFLNNYTLPVCNDCHPWTCRTTKRCRLDETGRFAALSDRFLRADAVVFGTPVYYGIASEAANSFMQRMHRMQANAANGIPALGIAIAGGTGGGLISGLQPLYHFFQVMGMRAVEPVPVTRFNLEEATLKAKTLGTELVEKARNRQPFAGLERLDWYDRLPYLGMSRVEERTYLVELVARAAANTNSPESKLCQEALDQAQILFDSGDRDAALNLIERAYNEGVKALERVG